MFFRFFLILPLYNLALLSIQEQIKQPPITKYRLFIGNPGTGKSTLANCIAKKVLFESGISFGSGKTYQLSKKKHGGIRYLDTPGLADMKMQQNAASLITKALKQDGKYQVFFVVTLSSGRVRAEDLATIWLVLQNAPDIDSVNIIINKLSPQEYQMFQNNDERSRLFAPLKLMSGRHKYRILLLKHSSRLQDAENMIENTPELNNFVEDTPWFDLDSSNVNEIPGDDELFKKQLDSFTDKVTNKSETMVRVLNFIQLLQLYFSITKKIMSSERRFNTKINSLQGERFIFIYSFLFSAIPKYRC